MDYSGLTLVRATPEQAVQSYKNHYPRWGAPHHISLEKFLNMIDIARTTLPGDRWACWVLVPRDDPTTLDMRAHCETYRRRSLLLRKGASTPEEVYSYGIGGVFCAPQHVGHNYAKHMMKLLHYVIAPRNTLPPFPDNWGAPPPTKGFQDATFSVLYSGIGTKYYASCTKGENEPGWLYHQVTSRYWTVPQDALTSTTAEYLRKKDMSALEKQFEEELKTTWARKQEKSKNSVVILPDTGIFVLNTVKYDNFADDMPHRPPGDHIWGMKTADGWLSCKPSPEKDGSRLLQITHVSGNVPFDAVLALAKEENCGKIEYWGPYDAWDSVKDGLEIKPEEELPAIAVYGLEDDVAWTLNEW